jgi:hypothetical protein
MRATFSRRSGRLALALVANMLVAAIAAGPAAAVDNPTEWVRGIYAKYAADQVDGSALDLFKPEATDRLKAAIAAEEACVARTEGICGLDFDPIAKFTNGGSPQVIEYYFLKMGDRWLLDDVSNRTPGTEPWTLTGFLGKTD